VVNVGDYMQKQEEQLRDLAAATAERARETGDPQLLYNLNPSQRRIIHMALSEEDVETVSEGEGRDRHLVVSLKKK
jgi:spoIIIJ-associated protein